MRLLLLLPLLAAVQVSAQPSSSPPAQLDARPAAETYQLAARPVEAGAIELDGRLDEDAWAEARPAGGFVQLRPSPGTAESEPTEARVLFDGTAIYVGMTMTDSQPGGIDARLGRRGSGFTSDWAMVAFDSYNDDRTAFLFQVSAGGVLNDVLLFDDVNEDDSWDPVWDARTARTATGWTAEFRIPFSQLRYESGTADPVWGVNFGRRHFRTQEQTFWAPLLPSVEGVVSRFGTLTGLRDLAAPRRLELLPYVSTSLVRAPGDAADPFYRSNDVAPRIGLDAKYGLTSNLTLTATLNPDFGQVEADPAQVNLRGFELFLSERRPFFVEGADVFSFGRTRAFFSNNRPDMLYTRRIGRSPQRGGFVSDAAQAAAGDQGSIYTSAPTQSTILGAAKLSGRVGRFSVGVLNAVTAPEYGRVTVRDGAGQTVMDERAIVEPLSSYSVARARTNWGRTYVGGAFTAVNRRLSDDALEQLLPSQAYVAGLDLEHTFASDIILSGVVAGSRLSGSPESVTQVQRAFPRLFQRPDAGHLSIDSTATSLQGLTGELSLTRSSGTNWMWSTAAAFTTPGFDANSLGFQSRADDAYLNGIVVYNQNEAQGPFQRWGANVYLFNHWNFDGDRTNTGTGFNANAQLKSFWGGNINTGFWPRTTNDRLTRGGPVGTDPAGMNINFNMYTDSRKAVSGFAWTGHTVDEIGGGFHGIEVGLNVRPSPALLVTVSPGLDVSTDERQFVGAYDAPALTETFGTRYVFGRIEQTSLSLNTRINWTFSPDLSLELYARPFVTRGQYDAYSQLGAPGQLRLPVFGTDVGTATRETDGSVTLNAGDGSEPISVAPDFTFRALQGNAVLRWQYRPGSALFLVWQQQRSGFESDGSLRFGRDVRGLFADPLENVFLVKLSYWLG